MSLKKKGQRCLEVNVGMLKGRDFLCLKDFSKEEILFLLGLSEEFKRKLIIKELHDYLKGKTAVILFEKPSTRTRISLEVACAHLGIHPIVITKQQTQLARGEPVQDFARVIERYVDVFIARVMKHEFLVKVAEYAKIPIINALSDFSHPLQALADFLTIMEKKDLRDVKIAYVGDGDNNVAHSLLFGSAILGLEIRIGAPKKYQPDTEVMNLALKLAEKNRGRIIVTDDPIKAVKDADVIYTDVWVSMGMEAEREERIKALQKYRVDANLVKHAAPDFIFMHCLPRHGREVSDDVFESEHSVVFDQAENRLHTAKAVLAALL